MKTQYILALGLLLLPVWANAQTTKTLFQKYSIIYYYQDFGTPYSSNSHVEVTALEDAEVIELNSKSWIVGHHHTFNYKDAAHKKVRVKISIDYQKVFRIVSFQDENAFNKALENLREVKYWLKVEDPSRPSYRPPPLPRPQ